MKDRKKTLGIGAAVGLIIGPLIGVVLIKIAHVPYLETRFAFGLLALGLLAGVILGSLGASLLGDRVERMSLGNVWVLIAIGIVVNIVETFVFVRRMIP